MKNTTKKTERAFGFVDEQFYVVDINNVSKELLDAEMSIKNIMTKRKDERCKTKLSEQK